MLAFGGSEFKLSATLGIKVEEAKAIIDKYFEAVPDAKKFLEACAAYGVKNGYIRSFKPFSLIRFFGGMDMRDKKQRGEVERMSKNTPIQGSSAIMTKLALVAVRERIKKLDYPVELFLQIHDAIYCYAPIEKAEEWADEQKAIMERCGRVFLKSIPCIADTHISDCWSK